MPELELTAEALMSTIQTLVSTAKVLVSVITSVSLLLPPSLIVTGFAKTVPNGTRIEIQIIA